MSTTLHAIIVGINRYHDASIGSLQYAVADASRLASLIENKIEVAERRVTLLVDEAATRESVQSAIGERLVETVQKDDIVLLYFACMGAPETSGGLEDACRYLVMHDSRRDRLYSTAIDMERDVLAWFGRLAQPRLTVALLDACFSGAAGGRTFEGPRLSRLREQHRARVSLRRLDVGKGGCIITACDDDQVAYEDHDLGHGVFSYYLIQGLTRGAGRSKLAPRSIGIASLYDEVVENVARRTNRAQIPIMRSGYLVHAKLPRLC